MTTFGFDKALLALLEARCLTRREWRPEVWGNAPVVVLAPEHHESSELGSVTMGRQFLLVTQVSTDDFYQRVWIPTHEDLLARDWEECVTMADKPAPKPDPSRTDSKPGNPRRTDTDIPDPGGDRKS